MVADLLFDPEVGLGLEIVRFNVGGSNTSADAVTSMRPFAAVPSVLLADGSYDWALVRGAVLLHVQRIQLERLLLSHAGHILHLVNGPVVLNYLVES